MFKPKSITYNVTVILITIVFTNIIPIGCAKDGTGTPDGRRITAQQAKAIADRNPGAILLDVRTKDEYRERRIIGATLLPIDSIGTKVSHVLPDKDALILVYCRRGARSRAATEILVSMGYTNVYDFGGIESNRAFGVEKNN